MAQHTPFASEEVKAEADAWVASLGVNPNNSNPPRIFDVTRVDLVEVVEENGVLVKHVTKADANVGKQVYKGPPEAILLYLFPEKTSLPHGSKSHFGVRR
jgi:hypothetical protein